MKTRFRKTASRRDKVGDASPVSVSWRVKNILVPADFSIRSRNALKYADGLRGEFLGSTAERVARYADCPVLIVRERERDFVSTNRAEKTAGKLPVERSAT